MSLKLVLWYMSLINQNQNRILVLFELEMSFGWKFDDLSILFGLSNAILL